MQAHCIISITLDYTVEESKGMFQKSKASEFGSTNQVTERKRMAAKGVLKEFGKREATRHKDSAVL